jgi:hypothetical protein
LRAATVHCTRRSDSCAALEDEALRSLHHREILKCQTCADVLHEKKSVESRLILYKAVASIRTVQRAVGNRSPVTLVQTAEAPPNRPFSACVVRGGHRGMRRLERSCQVLCNRELMQGGHVGFSVSSQISPRHDAFPMEKRGFSKARVSFLK